MSTKAPQVDSHFHIWDPARFNIPYPDEHFRHDVTMEEFEKNRTATPIDYAVFVQVVNCCPGETDWLLNVGEKYPSLKGIVAGLDLTKPELRDQLTKYKATGKVVGVRHLLHIEEQGFVLLPEIQKGLSVLQDLDMTFDLGVSPQLLKDSIEVTKKFPRLRFVLNHIGMPNMRGAMDPVWKQHITELGSLPNVYCKISGLVSGMDPNTWKADDFREHVEHVLHCFGVDRCMFGSDWPIGLKMIGATYSQVYELAKTLFEHRSQEDKDKYFGLNAIRIYKLDIST